MESARRNLLANPRQSANLLSMLFFGWSIPIFKKGYAKPLDSEDVYEPLDKDRSSNLGGRLERCVCYHGLITFVNKIVIVVVCFYLHVYRK